MYIISTTAVCTQAFGDFGMHDTHIHCRRTRESNKLLCYVYYLLSIHIYNIHVSTRATICTRDETRARDTRHDPIVSDPRGCRLLGQALKATYTHSHGRTEATNPRTHTVTYTVLYVRGDCRDPTKSWLLLLSGHPRPV